MNLVLDHLARFGYLKGREYLSRMRLLDTIMGFVKDCKVEGCYMEFGSADGDSLGDSFAAARRRGLAMDFYVFDSFQGLPKPTGLDGDGSTYQEGQFACGLEQFKRNVRRLGVDLNRVTLCPGWYSQTLTPELKRKLPVRKAAVVLIDCDLYESTVPVLEFITDYIQDGTVLIFDDWFSYQGRTDRGEARAFTEWLRRNSAIKAKEYHRTGRTIMSFVMQIGS